MDIITRETVDGKEYGITSCHKVMELETNRLLLIYIASGSYGCVI